MGRKIIDFTGKRFGKLVVASFAKRENGRTYWNCQCDCGNTRLVSSDHLKNGDVTDCGCLRRHLPSWKKHGMSNTRLYSIWTQMRRRCISPYRKEYKNYGGRGIRVCDEWANSFEAFVGWALANGYSDKLTLDRIDNNGDYRPDNCRWATRKEQSYNRRNNRYITYNGETETITQWAEENNMSYGLLKKRIDCLKWPFERAITEPLNTKYSNRKS